MLSRPEARKRLKEARKLRNDLKFCCGQIWVAVLGFLFLGYQYDLGVTDDQNGQKLLPFIWMWAAVFLLMIYHLWSKKRRFEKLLLELSEGFE